MPKPEEIDLLQAFFDRPVCQKATAPLKKGVEIAIQIDGAPAVTLRRTSTQMEVFPEPPATPDMTFSLTRRALEELAANPSEDIGEMGVAILQLLAHPEEAHRMRAKIHIGPIELFRRGYLSVLPLGGHRVMGFLGSKGFKGISKIKEGISRFRG